MQTPDSPPLIPTRFVWPHGGRHVHLCGSFTRWRESFPMAPVEGLSGVFAVVWALPPGYHQYKFIVDGEWRHDDHQAYMPDPLGNVNNWLLVRPPDPPQASPEPGSNILRPTQQGFQDSTLVPVLPLSPMPSMSQPQTSGQAGPAGQAGTTSGSMEVDPVEPNPISADAAVGEGGQKGEGMGGGGEDGSSAASGGGQGPPPMLLLPGEGAESVSPADAEASRQRIADFLNSHVAAELLPESGKVVALDITLPVKQAFHALYEQGVAAAPLWDSQRCEFVGMLTASDFIAILQQVRSRGGSLALSLSEAEVEAHSIAAWKEAKLALLSPSSAHPPHTPARRPLVHVGPDDSLRRVATELLRAGVASVPVLTGSPPHLLHLASLSGILNCIARHFRHVSGSLPLLAHPISSLPLGTWGPASGRPPASCRQLATLRPSTPLTTALATLLAEGVSSMAVVDEAGALLDVYARSDITALARERAYARLQLDDITVAEALRQRQDCSGGGGGPATRCHMCLQSDSLRSVIDRLALPGVRRLMCVEAGSRRVEGIISLADVFQFLLVA